MNVQEAAAALASLTAPEGWVLVPKVATEAMLAAWIDAEMRDLVMRECYEWMLAAAPAAPLPASPSPPEPKP